MKLILKVSLALLICIFPFGISLIYQKDKNIQNVFPNYLKQSFIGEFSDKVWFYDWQKCKLCTIDKNAVGFKGIKEYHSYKNLQTTVLDNYIITIEPEAQKHETAVFDMSKADKKPFATEISHYNEGFADIQKKIVLLPEKTIANTVQLYTLKDFEALDTQEFAGKTLSLPLPQKLNVRNKEKYFIHRVVAQDSTGYYFGIEIDGIFTVIKVTNDFKTSTAPLNFDYQNRNFYPISLINGKIYGYVFNLNDEEMKHCKIGYIASTGSDITLVSNIPVSKNLYHFLVSPKYIVYINDHVHDKNGNAELRLITLSDDKDILLDYISPEMPPKLYDHVLLYSKHIRSPEDDGLFKIQLDDGTNSPELLEKLNHKLLNCW
ncbi:MAG: hypothetical protein N2645_00885 [Clostridia bacterium]|nr:hypothetical protein [Clostridia bacterium]